MAEPRQLPRRNGFSLVEMLVALVFTMVLMAGMASVFKASLSSTFTSGEQLSSIRRNQMSLDLLGSDLNTACMYLINLDAPPTTSATNPPFYILPNMPITQINNTTSPPSTALSTDPTTSDELYFYLDQAFQFEGTLKGSSSQSSASELVNSGAAAATSDFTFTVDCNNNPSYAAQVQQAQATGNLSIIFKDSFKIANVTAITSVSGSQVTLVTGASATSGITGTGSSGLPTNFKHISGSGIVFTLPNQMVRYRLQMLMLDPDPTKPNGIPCLVRDQGTYSGSGFVVDNTQPQQIITENVQNFKVYLSANAGQGWAGMDVTTNGFTLGWGGTNPASGSQTIQGELNAQLVAENPKTATTIPGDPNWFRNVPILVRVDVTTRTANQRTEYSNTPNSNTAAYKQMTQSLVFVPYHSGLPINP
jgi:Tfp pilus assembly protein PilW